MDDPASTDESGDGRTTIRTGREFEQEYRLPASKAGEFLIGIGEQLREDDQLTIVEDEWELPFAFGEPVALEVDFDGVGEPVLELEVEIPGQSDQDAPAVE